MSSAAKCLILLAISGCATRVAPEPWPCQRILEQPKVTAELREMAKKKIYPATLEWATDADAKCAADRALVGEDPLRPEPSWWDRLFH